MSALPTLRQLRYLQALHQHGHFGRAAESCHVTQSTLSAGIAELEQMLEIRLVERTKRKVLFTTIGAEIANRGAALLVEAETLVELARSAVEPLSGPLRLGVIPTIAPYLLPRLMLPAKMEFPKLRLYLSEEQTAKLIDKLAKGQLDAGLLALPYPMNGLDYAEIGEDPFYLACPEDHPLAHKTDITVADLGRADLLLLEEGHCLRDHALAVCRAQPPRRHEDIRGTSLPTVLNMVTAGLGVTLLPRMAVAAGAAEGLVTRKLSGSGQGRQIALAWRASSPRGTEFRRLARLIAEKAMP